MSSHTNSRILISRSAMESNFRFFRERADSGTHIFPVIKANAYGHGMNLVVDILKETADGFCVHGCEEAEKLNGSHNVLVLGHISDDVDQLADLNRRHNIRFTVCDEGQLRSLETAAARTKRPIPLIIKVETGTHRLGLEEAEARRMADLVRESSYLKLTGFSTHFANIEDTTDHSYARRQLDRFLAFRKEVDQATKLEWHAACSAAALLFPDTHLDLIRLGISQYGYYSSRETVVSWHQQRPVSENGLKPALTWETRPIQVKPVKQGEFVGYGITYRAPRDMRIAVLPVGYSDGYDRGMSGQAHVLIRGKRAPVCGRICMNMFMVDVTDIPDANRNDTVTLIGTDGDETITAQHLADWCGSIHYEVLARIRPGITRIVVD